MLGIALFVVILTHAGVMLFHGRYLDGATVLWLLAFIVYVAKWRLW